MSNFDVEKWMEEVKREIDVKLKPYRESPCIFSASTALLREYEHAYVPQMVSIGPYHFGKEHLRGIETFKDDAVSRELLRSQIKAGDKACSFNQVVERIISMEDEIRCCYDKELPYNSEVLGWMMARDASFILEFLRCLLWESLGDYERFNEDGDSQILQRFHPIFGSKSNPVVRADIMKDLIKLENQIPLFVLEQVLSMEMGDRDLEKAKSKLQVLLKAVFDKIYYRPFEFLADSSTAPRPSNHILETYYYFCLGDVAAKEEQEEENTIAELKETEISTDLRVKVPDALQLKNGGVKFEAATGGNIKSIKFEGTTLTIVPIQLYVDSEIFIRNLIALENCSPLYSHRAMTAYSQFMEELCQTPMGVDVMREKGIIIGNLWHHDRVFQLWNSLNSSKLTALQATYPTINITRATVSRCYKKEPCNMQIKFNEKLWVGRVVGDLALDMKLYQTPPCIFSASKALMKECADAYAPQLVSIGPYHYKKVQLKRMERYKNDALCRELLRILKLELEAPKKFMGDTFNQLVAKIKSMEYMIRSSYDKEILYESEELCLMMARDACFILEFFRCCCPDTENFCFRQRFHPIFGSESNPVLRADILKDLIKLENQIPLFVLEEVLSMEMGGALEDARSRLNKLLKDVFHRFYYQPFSDDEPSKQRGNHILDMYWTCTGHVRGNHILDMYYYHCVGHEISVLDKLEISGEAEGEIQRSKKFPSAVDLKNGGVKIQAKGNRVENVDFKDGTLSIPRVNLSVDSEIFLRNLIAFEISCTDCTLRRMTAFVQFMNELCQTEKGAAVMRDNGVIGGSLWQHSEVARFFSSCKQSGLILPRGHPIEVTRNTLMDYYSKKSRIIVVGKWNEFWNSYGSKPWLVVGGMAAATVLSLTAIQVHCLYHHCGPP